MRSIIDEIAAAEEQAEQIRLNAVQQAREETAKAREQAQQALATLVAQDREASESMRSEAQSQGEQRAQETLAGMIHEADERCAHAGSRVEPAIAYLVEKVTKSA
jgi:vacuolar-type H+-ATPase subunit H